MAMTKAFKRSLLVTGLFFATPALADEAPPKNDNTAKNKAEAPTADQSKNGKSDVKLTAEIRRSIMKDDTLSTAAHNVKIIVEAGIVTLKGPVKTAGEKSKVAAKATEVVGASNVKNEIEIAP